MDIFTLQPGIYSTSTSHTNLFDILDELWLHPDAKSYAGGTYYLLAGFGTHNGGVPFFEKFRHHVNAGGRVRAVLAGSRTMRLASQQLAAALLDCGAEVAVVNRRQLMHAKLYGTATAAGEQHLVVTSGNFTTPGTKLNIEASLSMGPTLTTAIGFSWQELYSGLQNADIEFYDLGPDQTDPVWSLLYDETTQRPGRNAAEADDEEDQDLGSIVMTLGTADTRRIQAEPGSSLAKGSQYFWLSKDSYDFFPPLTIPNERGTKATYSAKINVDFVDLSRTEEVTVTFEAENNLDFRLGTGPLRRSKLAQRGDLMVLTRRGQADYELRLVPAGTVRFHALRRYALTPVGTQGKMAGFVPNSVVDEIFSN